MDINLFFNPNIAYLVLVGGFLLAILAVFSPGTGLLEAGALICLVLAGWAVSNLPVNLWALILLLLGVPPFLLAVRKSGKVIYLLFAILSLEFGSIYLFQGDVWWKPAVNPFLALVVVILTSGYLWIAVRKTLEAILTRPSHDLTSLVGQIGEAKTDIFIDGTCQVAGELWSAQSRAPIPSGAAVKVIAREGFILTVDKA